MSLFINMLPRANRWHAFRYEGDDVRQMRTAMRADAPGARKPVSSHARQRRKQSSSSSRALAFALAVLAVLAQGLFASANAVSRIKDLVDSKAFARTSSSVTAWWSA